MSIAKRIAMRAIGLAALSLIVAAFVFVPRAFAQTMGEYGLMVNHSAASAGAMRKLAPTAMPPMRVESSGGIQTYEIPDSAAKNERDEGSEATNARSKDPNDDSNGADWDQVK